MADRAGLPEAALDSLSEDVAFADHDGTIALWNRAAESIVLRDGQPGGNHTTTAQEKRQCLPS